MKPPQVSEKVSLQTSIPGAHWVLLAVAVWSAWRPVETFPFSAVFIAAAVLGLVVWSWRRTAKGAGPTGNWIAVVLAAVVLSGVAGRDPSAAIGGGALAVAVVVLIWMASREKPPEYWPAVFALAVSGLAIWGLLQVTAGPERTQAMLSQLPEALRAAAAERLTSGRAFASQPLPSHLAVLFATALPLLLARFRWNRSAVVWGLGAALCVVGLALTRSPIGIGLALVACAALACVRGGRAVRLSVLALGLVLVAAVMLRGDVREMEPVDLRVDNWRTAVWVWSTAPVTGVGFGGFGQAAQAVPFTVGNRPRYAHSLPMEWLAEFGPLGLLMFAALAWAGWRLLRRVWPERPELTAALAVIPLHNLVDFSLHGSGVALPWAILLGWAVAFGDPKRDVDTGPPGRMIAATAAAAGVAVALLHATSVSMSDAAAGRPDPMERYAGAVEARRLAPWRPDPLYKMAIAALESGDRAVVAEAADELERGRWLRPNSAGLADLRGRLAQVLGRAPTAAGEAWTARHLHPVNSGYRENLSQLLLRLQGATHD